MEPMDSLNEEEWTADGEAGGRSADFPSDHDTALVGCDRSETSGAEGGERLGPGLDDSRAGSPGEDRDAGGLLPSEAEVATAREQYLAAQGTREGAQEGVEAGRPSDSSEVIPDEDPDEDPEVAAADIADSSAKITEDLKDLQEQMGENSETAQLLSNIAAMRHNTAMGIIGNIR
jgi:hypothetical protein